MREKRIPLPQVLGQALRLCGLDARPALKQAGLPLDLLERQGVHLHLSEYLALWQAFDHCLPEGYVLQLVQAVRPSTFDPVVFSALCSADFNTAVVRLRLFKALLGPMRLVVDANDQFTKVAYQVEGVPALALPTGLIHTEVTFFVGLVRMATEHPVTPRGITVPCKTSTPRVLQAFWGCQLTEGDEVSVVFDAVDARRPFVTENQAMWETFEPAFKQRLLDLQASAGLLEKVRAQLIERLPSGQVGMADVAAQLLMSSRTLQRRLGEEGTTFQAVLRSAREELAHQYLKTSALSGSQIAYLLGFDSPNSFSRAFHQWKGTTPEQYRLQ